MLSAFFSSNETALMSVNKIRLRSLADSGNKRAATVLDVLENHTAKMLSAILIGNNIVNLSASALATSLAYAFGGYMVSIATAVLTVAILVFGEITPKNYATLKAEKVTLRYIPIIRFFMTVMTPVIFIINLFSRFIMLLLRVDPNGADRSMTEDELRTIVDVSHEDGVIESDEKEMIYNVFDLGDANAKDIMVPRVHVTFADINNTYDELINIFREDKFTRLPVFEDTQDNIVGIINIILQVNRQDSQLNLRIYIFITGCQHLRFRPPKCGMHGRQLTIHIGGLHCIGIYNRHPSDACTADHLGGISTYSTQSHDQYVRAPDAFHLFLP